MGEQDLTELVREARDKIHFGRMIIAEDLATSSAVMLPLEQRESGVAGSAIPSAVIGRPLTVSLVQRPGRALKVFQNLLVLGEDVIGAVRRVLTGGRVWQRGEIIIEGIRSALRRRISRGGLCGEQLEVLDEQVVVACDVIFEVEIPRLILFQFSGEATEGLDRVMIWSDFGERFTRR